MESIKLNNDINMPLVGLGTWNLRGQECIDTICKSIELGYRLIDTAQMYGNEKEVGLGIMKSGIDRKEVFITTKIYRISNSYSKAKRAIRDSLNNLQVEYIDLLLLHEPYKQGPEMYRALEEAYKEGLLKAIGISNYNESWYKEFLLKCSIIPAVNQVETHMTFQKWNLQELLESNSTRMQAWSPLGQGVIDMNNEVILRISNKYGKTPAQVMLKFLTQRGISVIPKSKHENRLKENIDIFDFNLTEQEIKEIRSLDLNKTLFSWTESF